MDIPKNNEQAELVYKNTPQRDLMLTFLPPLAKKYENAPVYFIIPGGGWHMEVRQDMINFSHLSVEALRNEGFAVVSPDYRICKEGVIMSEIIADCFDAAKYIANFSDELEIDKEKFVLSGHSAGAHLALMLSYAPQDLFCDDYEFSDEFKVVAAAPLSPPTILYSHTTHNLRDIVDVFKECYTKEEMEKTSPITYITQNCPPSLCVPEQAIILFLQNHLNWCMKN